MKKIGKIIAVVGAPASGKSTLVSSLAKIRKVRYFLEKEEELPGYIKDNIKRNKNGLQTILFFHNRAVDNYIKSIKLKSEGKTVILDTFWLSNLFYLDTMLPNKNERELIKKFVKLIAKFFPMPDSILFLDVSDKILKERLEKRGRKFEKDFLKSAIRISQAHRNYFRNNLKKITLTINADKLEPRAIAKIIGI
jgi:deoxyadenosine/deoxycytidine kinase